MPVPTAANKVTHKTHRQLKGQSTACAPTSSARVSCDGEFTTVQEVAAAALFFASFESNALTGQSLIASHRWFMQ